MLQGNFSKPIKGHEFSFIVLHLCFCHWKTLCNFGSMKALIFWGTCLIQPRHVHKIIIEFYQIVSGVQIHSLIIRVLIFCLYLLILMGSRPNIHSLTSKRKNVIILSAEENNEAFESSCTFKSDVTCSCHKGTASVDVKTCSSNWLLQLFELHSEHCFQQIELPFAINDGDFLVKLFVKHG